MNRKTFLTLGASMAAASLTARSGESILSSFAEEEPQLPLIDTHQHLWDIGRFREGWSVPPFGKSFTMQDYLAATEGLNLVKAVYLEVAVPPAKRYEEALYAIEVCKDPTNPTVAAVIAGDPTRPDFETYIRKFEGSPYVKGIRYFFSNENDITSPQVIANIRLLGRLQMHFEFVVPVKWLAAVARLREACPDTAFAVDHCGNVDPRAFFTKETLHHPADHALKEWQSPMQAMASFPNTICKISGVVTRAPGFPLTVTHLAPAVNSCLDMFGPERVVFASDWPVCLKGTDIRTWVKLLKAVVADRPAAYRKKLFHDNAINFYRL